MKFKKKERQEYMMHILVFVAFILCSSGIVAIGVYKYDPVLVVSGVTLLCVSFLIPMLATAALMLKAGAYSRKKILRTIRKKKCVDKSITKESK
jgi:hypothetical protein